MNRNIFTFRKTSFVLCVVTAIFKGLSTNASTRLLKTPRQSRSLDPAGPVGLSQFTKRLGSSHCRWQMWVGAIASVEAY